ncbi:MAG: cephalosporin hydroxylase [bacterium]|nr:cephalosporin hydroxylase [bacterium]
MGENERFRDEVRRNIAALGEHPELREEILEWAIKAAPFGYVYNFTWMGRPIIQYPQDVMAMQEIAWKVQPDLIIETGVARGGSILFYASLLELMGGDGRVLGIDIDIRGHNRAEMEQNRFFHRVDLVEGSSVSAEVLAQVRELAVGKERILVCLDSNHTHEHVMKELELYAPFVTPGSYMVVCDTVVEDMPAHLSEGKPWGPGDSPKTAVHEFLATTDRFEIDAAIVDKIQLTVAPDGYLRCIK